MANEMTTEAAEAEDEKGKLQEEKKRLKKEQKEQKKEAKRRAKEIARQEDELEDDGGGSGVVTFAATILIIFLWIAVICVIVKLDIGGFGSSVLSPILKNVPVVNKILPGSSAADTTDSESYGGYSSLEEAVDAIRQLELEVDRLQTSCDSRDEQIETLTAENDRLKQFEEKQVEFQRIQNEFYEEVVYAEKGPGAEEFRKWYEEMDPTTAESLYRQVVTQSEESQEIQDYANTYSQMKPKAAAAIFEEMTDDLNLVAKILGSMTSEERGDILAAMDSEVAAKLTKIMNPDS